MRFFLPLWLIFSVCCRAAGPLEQSRLAVTLHKAATLPQQGKPELTSDVTILFSNWTAPGPDVEAAPVAGRRVETSYSGWSAAGGEIAAAVRIGVAEAGKAPGVQGEFALRLKLQGTSGAGTYEGIFDGKPVSGSARASLVFDRQSEGRRRLRAWLPGMEREVRAILLWGNGAGGDQRDMAQSEELQAFAAANGLAVVGTAYFGNSMRSGQGQLILGALRALAGATGHPELEHAPIIFTGHSNGGQMAYEFNAWMPARVVAFNAWRGGYYHSYDHLPSAALATPGVLSAGEVDQAFRVQAIRRLFDTNRPLGADWSLLVEEKMGHEQGNTLGLLLLFFQHALEQRLPARASSRKGTARLRPVNQRRAWLADNSTWKEGITRIYPARSYKGDRTRLSWLLDADVAVIYRGLASYANPLVLTRAGHGSVYSQAEPVVLECADFGGLPWESVSVFEGARAIGWVAPGKEKLVIRGPLKPGAHAAVLVGRLPDGGLRTSIPVAWYVRPERAK